MSLRSRVVLLLALLGGSIAVVPAIYLPRVLEQQTRRWVEGRYLDVARATAALTEAPLEFDDARGAAEALAALGRTRGAAYARLLRADGGILASWGTAPARIQVPASDGDVAYGGDLLHLRVDTAGRGGGRGILVAGFHLDELEERRREAAAVVWRTTGVALAVAVAAAFLLGTLLLKPLRRVTDLAARIAGGDEDATGLLAELERGDETGRFAASLGKVVERLAEQRTLLRSLSEASSEAILTLAPGGGVLFHNRRLAELVGAGSNQALGSWAEVRERLRPRIARALPAWMESDGPRLPAPHAEAFPLELKDGRLLEAYAAEVATRGGASRALGLYVRDISRLSDAEGSVRALQASLEGQVGQISQELERAHAALAARTADLDAARSRMEAAERRLALEGLPAGATQEITRLVSQLSASLAYGLKGVERLAEALRSGGSGERVLAAGTASTMTDTLLQAKAAVDRIGQMVRGRSQAPGPPARKPVAPSPAARILVVDDEPLVGAAVRRMLGRDHEVEVATSGADALGRLRRGEHFDLLICDLVMPGLGGAEVAEQIGHVSPSLAQSMLFMSSGILSAAAEAFVEKHERRVLRKPFDRGALLRLVEERLEPRSRNPGATA